MAVVAVNLKRRYNFLHLILFIQSPHDFLSVIDPSYAYTSQPTNKVLGYAHDVSSTTVNSPPSEFQIIDIFLWSCF